MKKLSFTPFIIAVIFLLVFGKTGSYGQASISPYWLYDSHYLNDKYLINPAFAGYAYYPKVFVGTQREDVQHPEAPSVHVAGFHSRLGIRKNYYSEYLSNYKTERSSIGGFLFADNNGPYHSVGIKLDYVYSVQLDHFNFNTLSFGLGGIFFSKSIKLGDKTSSWTEDPFIASIAGNKMNIPDVNAGLLFSHREKFYVGFSVTQLLENTDNDKSNLTVPPVYRNYYFLTGYRFAMNWLEIEPSVAVGHNMAPKNHGQQGKFVDVNLELFLKPVVFTQSFRVDGYLTSQLLYRAKKLEMGVRAEWLSFNNSNARVTGVALMISYTFVPTKFKRDDE